GGTLRMLEDKFADVDPSHPFEYRFLDDSLRELYVSEQSLMKLIGVFAGICILISCLGLYGLSAFTTEQRTKEIGNTLLLVLTGAVVASIVAWLAIDEWLAGFAYRAPINPLIFVVAAIAAAVVAFVTIALQSSRTARADPANALRYE
ncbi:MAG: ABC transporter permease, partial [Gammaproteobacteria bacterium]